MTRPGFNPGQLAINCRVVWVVYRHLRCHGKLFATGGLKLNRTITVLTVHDDELCPTLAGFESAALLSNTKPCKNVCNVVSTRTTQAISRR